MIKGSSNDELIARVVAAFASRPDTSADDIVSLAVRLRGELAGAAPAEPAAAAADGSAAPDTTATAPRPGSVTPALPVDKAITRDTVYCLCCGKGFKMLKRHLGAEHGLTEAEYRTLFDLPEDMPLVAPSYSNRKAEYAKQAGLGKYRRDAGRASRTEPGAATS